MGQAPNEEDMQLRAGLSARLEALVVRMGISKRRWAIAAGMAPAQVANATATKPSSLQFETLHKLIAAARSIDRRWRINGHWLLVGDGPMLLEETSSQPPSSDVSPNRASALRRLEGVIDDEVAQRLSREPVPPSDPPEIVWLHSALAMQLHFDGGVMFDQPKHPFRTPARSSVRKSHKARTGR